MKPDDLALKMKERVGTLNTTLSVNLSWLFKLRGQLRSEKRHTVVDSASTASSKKKRLEKNYGR